MRPASSPAMEMSKNTRGLSRSAAILPHTRRQLGTACNSGRWGRGERRQAPAAAAECRLRQRVRQRGEPSTALKYRPATCASHCQAVKLTQGHYTCSFASSSSPAGGTPLRQAPGAALETLASAEPRPERRERGQKAPSSGAACASLQAVERRLQRVWSRTQGFGALPKSPRRCIGHAGASQAGLSAACRPDRVVWRAFISSTAPRTLQAPLALRPIAGLGCRLAARPCTPQRATRPIRSSPTQRSVAGQQAAGRAGEQHSRHRCRP